MRTKEFSAKKMENGKLPMSPLHNDIVMMDDADKSKHGFCPHRGNIVLGTVMSCIDPPFRCHWNSRAAFILLVTLYFVAGFSLFALFEGYCLYVCTLMYSPL